MHKAGGRGSFHLASQLFGEHLSVNISRHGKVELTNTYTHTHTHTTQSYEAAAIVKIETASSRMFSNSSIYRRQQAAASFRVEKMRRMS